MKKIVFACGGTLGHINPAIAVADELIKEYQITFISTSKEFKNNTFKDKPYKIYYYDFFGMSRKKLLKNFNYLKINIDTYKKIKALFKEFKPDILISMGGACGTIALLAAHKLKIKTIIHEQNSILGFGNKLVLNKCNKLLLSYPIKNKKGILVGNPIESVFYNLEKKTKEENLILIFGGSNGATFINDFFIDNYNIFHNYNIVLLTGEKYFNKNLNKIKSINSSKFLILPKTDNMISFYNKAKIVIARGGATTLSEIMGLSKPSIIIPSPNVTNNHQYYNASYYESKGCLLLIREKDLNIEVIKKHVNLLNNDDNLKKIKQNIHEVHNIYSIHHFIGEIKKELGEKNE